MNPIKRDILKPNPGRPTLTFTPKSGNRPTVTLTPKEKSPIMPIPRNIQNPLAKTSALNNKRNG